MKELLSVGEDFLRDTDPIEENFRQFEAQIELFKVGKDFPPQTFNILAAIRFSKVGHANLNKRWKTLAANIRPLCDEHYRTM